MKLLLDTHALLWALSAPEKLSSAARRALEESSNALWISSVSFFEIASKVRNGKLPPPGPLLTHWDLTVSRTCSGSLSSLVSVGMLTGDARFVCTGSNMAGRDGEPMLPDDERSLAIGSTLVEIGALR